MIRNHPEAIAIGAILFLGMGASLLDSIATHVRGELAPIHRELRLEQDNFRVERDRFRTEQQEKLRIERERFRSEGQRLREELHRAFRFRRV